MHHFLSSLSSRIIVTFSIIPTTRTRAIFVQFRNLGSDQRRRKFLPTIVTLGFRIGRIPQRESREWKNTVTDGTKRIIVPVVLPSFASSNFRFSEKQNVTCRKLHCSFTQSCTTKKEGEKYLSYRNGGRSEGAYRSGFQPSTFPNHICFYKRVDRFYL